MPAAVTNALTAAEASLVNRLLARLPDATTALASFGVYHQLLSLALMPTVATAVAVLPYVARNVPEGRNDEVRRNLRRTLWLAVGLGLAFTVPAGVLFPVQIARFFVRGDETAIASPTTLSALRLLPLAALSATPFLLLRPVFEATQQPRLGVLVSVARFLLFSFPLVFLGRALAPKLGLQPLTGVIAGLITASALASLVTARKAAACLGLSRP
jgi:Na+-driven multidrug efflux pump